MLSNFKLSNNPTLRSSYLLHLAGQLRAPSPELAYKGLIQMFLKLIGLLGSPCDCSLMGDSPCALYDG